MTIIGFATSCGSDEPGFDAGDGFCAEPGFEDQIQTLDNWQSEIRPLDASTRTAVSGTVTVASTRSGDNALAICIENLNVDPSDAEVVVHAVSPNSPTSTHVVLTLAGGISLNDSKVHYTSDSREPIDTLFFIADGERVGVAANRS